MRKLSKLVATCNEGRGKPLTYRLIPLSLLQDYLSFSIKADTMLQTLEEASLVRVVQLFDQMSEAQQKLNDFFQDAISFKYCVRPEDLTKISSLKGAMAVEETSFRSELSKVLIEVRSGKSDVSHLEDLFVKFQSSDVSPQKITTILATWGDLIEKINFARTLTQSGAVYIGLGGSLDEEILKDFEAKSYVLYFKQRSKSEEPERWNGNRQLFFQELKKNNKDHKYYAVDCDIHPTMMIKGCSSCVQVVQAGQLITKDMLEEQEKLVQIPFARVISGTERILNKPNKRVLLDIQCTAINCNPSKVYEWTCKKCLDRFDYGFDHHVYCKCGKTPAICLEFKCTDPNHGLGFERHDEKFLIQILDTLRPFQEMNILILGETGVGKSTWINGFINFLTYESLEEAESSETLTLIPSEFTVCDENFDEILVSTGVDANEVLQAGQSATQDAKVYPFNVGNTTIRLIDTPGIGDTRGIEQDKKNFQNILGTLSHLDEIHGICILLKPNNARLNVMFRFCIKELLTYLHKDAARNIMFCFTNSRGTFYRPGDTMPALKRLLAENQQVEIPVSRSTVYCFDSEAYRFLAAVKNKPPVKFPDDERANFSNSWEKSIVETTRMLEHIRNLPPHKIKSTLNLNHSRELVLKLARPLAEISRNIQTNKSIVEDERKEIERTKESIEELKKKQMTTRTEIEVRRINHPKTVCSNSSCVKVWNVNNVTTTEYIQVCHNHCYLSGIKEDSIGDPGLMGCWAMINGTCRHSTCRHHYREHLHVYYDSVQVAKQVEDQSVKESLNENLSAAEMKQKMIDSKKKEVAEYEYELERIEKASIKFAYFLKSNAITPYNDAMEQYLNHLIREEEDKVGRGGNRATLDNLKKSKESYVAQKSILEQEMVKGNAAGGMAPPGPADVEKLVVELKQLKHSGKTLKEALECVDHANRVVYKETVMKQPRYNNYTNQKKQKKGQPGVVKRIMSIFF